MYVLCYVCWLQCIKSICHNLNKGTVLLYMICMTVTVIIVYYCLNMDVLSLWCWYFIPTLCLTSIFAVAEGPRDALVSRNSATTKYPI